MIGNLFEALAWLPATPADFKARVRAALDARSPGGELRTLATHALELPDLGRLAGAVRQAPRVGVTLAPLVPFKLGVLGNGTLDFIVPALVGSALRHGIALECIVAPFGLYAEQCLEPQSVINQSRCDAVLLSLDARAVALQPCLGAAADGSAKAVGAALDLIDTLRDGLRRNSGATSIVQTLAAPPEALFGSADRAIAGTPRNLVDTFNRELTARLRGSGDVVLDVAALAETVGLGRWHCPAQWNLAKLPFDVACIPIFADHVGRLLAALRGKSRRCLVLDLDNTVWGGVVGDDGIEGVDVAEGSATGEAFRAVQRLALELRSRGVVLAVSSKNDDAVARRVFREHPEMLLREEHVAVFQANWSDKATNIRAISEALSLGMDSLVFLDDNPVERGIVRQMIPDVAVPELPSDPAYYARTLAAAGYFESTALSDEDRGRAAFYEGNARRVALKSTAGNLESYYASLEMEIHYAPFDAVGRTRIVQLINKSNQYNLTSRRYSEAEIAALEKDPECYTLQVRLTDVFGDNGMISVVICRTEEARTWAIDTWLMSCRVLGRNVEQMVLRELMLAARRRGIDTLIGRFKPSGRNEMVRDHYRKLGFVVDEARGVWVHDTAAIEPAATMRIKRTGFQDDSPEKPQDPGPEVRR